MIKLILLRLFIQLLLIVIVSLAHFIPNNLAILIIFVFFGYLLSSFDLILLIENVFKKLSYNSIYPADISNSETNKNKNLGLDWKDWLFHFIFISLVLITSIVSFLLSEQNASSYSLQIETTLLYIGIGIFIIVKILGDLQSVYIFFGIFRNPLFPKNCLNSSVTISQSVSINQHKLFFKIIKYIRIILIRIVTPILLSVVISIDCAINKIYNDVNFGYLRTICVLRAFRWVNLLFFFLIKLIHNN